MIHFNLSIIPEKTIKSLKSADINKWIEAWFGEDYCLRKGDLAIAVEITPIDPSKVPIDLPPFPYFLPLRKIASLNEGDTLRFPIQKMIDAEDITNNRTTKVELIQLVCNQRASRYPKLLTFQNTLKSIIMKGIPSENIESFCFRELEQTPKSNRGDSLFPYGRY